MNIPLGAQEIAGKALSGEAVRDIISFMDANKTGYFCVTTSGERGLEDGLLVIESGGILGAHYAYLAFGKEHAAGEALKRVVNAIVAKNGVYDSYTLTAQQLELLKIFNENILLLERIPLRSFEGMVPVAYSEEFERQELAALPKKPKSVLAEHGLEEIRIDNYADIKASVESAVPAAGAADKVADKVKGYLSGEKPKEPVPPREEPTEKPLVEDMKPPEKVEALVDKELDTETTQELEELNQQAEKLKKLLLKET
ncbi:MAG: DUF2226 domain-containing protein [Candidatus Diapherotrites archaeon]|nr:DUF2226 domain-containing protein [Candidatus Diapherotrites archaeon]